MKCAKKQIKNRTLLMKNKKMKKMKNYYKLLSRSIETELFLNRIITLKIFSKIDLILQEFIL